MDECRQGSHSRTRARHIAARRVDLFTICGPSFSLVTLPPSHRRIRTSCLPARNCLPSMKIHRAPFARGPTRSQSASQHHRQTGRGVLAAPPLHSQQHQVAARRREGFPRSPVRRLAKPRRACLDETRISIGHLLQSAIPRLTWQSSPVPWQCRRAPWLKAMAL